MIRPRLSRFALFVSALHLTASLLIVPFTLRVGAAWPDPAQAPAYRLLALATKVLYFPILTLALFPRHWFPGHLITIPIAVNSLLWGAALALAWGAVRRLRT